MSDRADQLEQEQLVTATHVALVALLVRYLNRKPGRVVLTRDELAEALRLILGLQVTFQYDDHGALSIDFESWHRSAVGE